MLFNKNKKCYHFYNEICINVQVEFFLFVIFCFGTVLWYIVICIILWDMYCIDRRPSVSGFSSEFSGLVSVLNSGVYSEHHLQWIHSSAVTLSTLDCWAWWLSLLDSIRHLLGPALRLKLWQKRGCERWVMGRLFYLQFLCSWTWVNRTGVWGLTVCGTLQWMIKALRGGGLSGLSGFCAVVCRAPASLLSSSSSDRRLFSLSSRDSLSSVESSAVLSLLSSASMGPPSLVSASGERTLELGSRASPRSRVMFPSSRRRWTMLWGCCEEKNTTTLWNFPLWIHTS